MSSRSEFLTTSAASVVAAHAEAVAQPREASPYHFAEVAARLGRAARHRQVFAVPRVADGVVTGLMRHGLDAYEIVRGEGPGALHPAAVFYARGVVLGCDDAAWRAYRLGDAVRRRGDVLAATATGNPFSRELSELTQRGATLLVCDNALADLATYLVTEANFNDRPIETVHASLRRQLFPGALLVPAGVAALNEAQEARFTFVQAS